jgi:RNA polymerase sigma-70 factor, ECF subfamily
LDSQAFRQLALAQLDALYRMAMHLTRNSDEAQDLVQETYLKAFAAAERFELRDGGLKPWLFKILHNSFYTRISRRQREATPVQDMAPLSAVNDEPACWDLSTLDWEQVDDRLKRAIDDLPPHYREVLLLWAVEGLKYREIADVLDVALGTVMSRLYRVRAILSHQLSDLAAEHGLAAPPADKD